MGEKSRSNFHLAGTLNDKRWQEIFGDVEDQLDEDDAHTLELINRRLDPKNYYKSVEEFWDQYWGEENGE